MEAAPKKELSLFDSTAIIVGIVIGAGIYETVPLVAASMGDEWRTLLIWLVGGLIALTGAASYAELAAAFPHEGGDYIYMTRAYGRWAGFLFGWAQMALIRPGDIALMAFVFARYARTLFNPLGEDLRVYAVAAVLVLTAVNVLGVRQGKWTQNLLTTLKVVGLLGVVGVGLFGDGTSSSPPEASAPEGGISLALILVLFTYGGWNEMAYVAGEVRNPERNVFRALAYGTTAVIGLYLLANGAFLRALGYEGVIRSEAVAVETVAQVFPSGASAAIAGLICVSALGAVNGLIFTGSRISYALGVDHQAFRRLGQWHTQLGTPIGALLLQGGLSLLIVLGAGSFVDTIVYTAPVVWFFFLATAVSLFVLRKKEPHRARPYRLTGYPLTAFLFCVSCAFMLFSSFSYAWRFKRAGLAVMTMAFASGGGVYALTQRLVRKSS